MRQGIEQQTNRTETQPQWGGPRRPVVVQNSCFACPGVTSPMPRSARQVCQALEASHVNGGTSNENVQSHSSHVLVLDKAAFFMRPLPCRAALVVMGMLPVVVMVRAARHHVPDLVHELQPHHQRPCGKQRVRGESGCRGDVLGLNHDGVKLAWMVGIWRETG